MMQFFPIEFLSPRIFSAETTIHRSALPPSSSSLSPTRINSINRRWRRVVYSVNYTFMAAVLRIREEENTPPVKSPLTAIFRV